MNNKTLIIIFVSLLFVLVGVQYIKKSKGERNFKEELIQIDTAKVTSVTLINKGNETILISKNNNKWVVSINGKVHFASKPAVKALLAAMTEMKTSFVAGLSKDDWQKTGCSDTAAMLVKVASNNNVLAKFYVGSFKFDYPQTVTTYIRLASANEVYGVQNIMPDVFKRANSEWIEWK